MTRTLLLIGLSMAATQAATSAAAAAEKARLEFFVMSKCPFGAQVQKAIVPVLRELGPAVEFSQDFIGTDSNGTLASMHGESEVQGDKIQLCASRLAPTRYLELVDCMASDMGGIPDNWEVCAERAKIPAGPLQECVKGADGTTLLRASFKRSADRSARGSPTMFLNGQPYQGGRSALTFTRAICAELTKKPAACARLPAAEQVHAIILSDSRCKDCRTDTWRDRLGQMISGVEIRVEDWGTAAGKKLYQDLGLKFLPVVLFGPEIRKAEEFDRIERFLRPRGAYLVLDVGAKFDPSAEICDNGVDDDQNGKLDCADPGCQFTLTCRAEQKGKLEVFVMSQCPYAVRGLDAMREILAAFGNRMSFEIHFIADERDGGFSSLHGQPEVDENIRQLCAIKIYGPGRKYLDYIWCRNKDIRSSDWKACTGATTGIDAVKIEGCVAQEGRSLLSRDILLAQGLEIGGSPTWVVNGRNKFNGIDAPTIQRNFCQYNPELKGCSAQMLSPPVEAEDPNCGN